MKENRQNVEQRTELEEKAEKFLDLLYNYDFVGENAYFRKADPGAFYKGESLYRRSEYHAVTSRKFIWMIMPHPPSRLGITENGTIFRPKNYRTYSGRNIGNIDEFLNPDLWGKKIFRVHTSHRRGIGEPGESGIFHYHDLHIRDKFGLR